MYHARKEKMLCGIDLFVKKLKMEYNIIDHVQSSLGALSVAKRDVVRKRKDSILRCRGASVAR